MSRFADPGATRTVDLGPCECPGTPHESDWAKVRSDLSGPELSMLLQLVPGREEQAAEIVAPFITEWNLSDDDGVVAITPESVYLLRGPTLSAIGTALGEVLAENLKLPNPSGAPSRASSRGSASRTRTRTRTPGT